jgi:hypothetical protein
VIVLSLVRRASAVAVALVVVALVSAGCGSDEKQADTSATTTGSSTSSTGSSSTTAAAVDSGSTSTAASQITTITTTLVNGKPHFASPEDAMTYLADAWNRNDLVSLKHVTDPSARDELNSMHGVATNLRLDHCDKNPPGDYSCFFDHDYPPHASTTMAMDDPQTGHAEFLVGPAATPGWYMTVFESCS